MTALSPKGSRGARELMRALAKGESVALLVDQKFNGGVAAPFLASCTAVLVACFTRSRTSRAISLLVVGGGAGLTSIVGMGGALAAAP